MWRNQAMRGGWRWDDGVIFQASRRRLRRSTDGGGEWAEVLEYGNMPPIDTPEGALLVGDNAVGSGAARSIDGGVTWTPAAWPGGGGLPNSLLVVDPTPELPAGRVVGAGFGGVAYSDDDGRSWQASEIFGSLAMYSQGGVRITGGPEDGVLLVSLDGVPNGLSGGVWRSENGRDWELIGRTFEDVVAVNLVAGPDGQVYAWQQETDRVLGSGDGGRTWKLLSREVDSSYDFSPRDMIVGPDGRLYVSGFGRPIPIEAPIYRTVDPVVAVANTPAPPEASGATLRVNPNPASGAARIALRLASPEAARLRVFDARGREVHAVASGARGTHDWEVSTAGWAPGVYIVRAEVGGEIVTAQLTIAR